MLTLRTNTCHIESTGVSIDSDIGSLVTVLTAIDADTLTSDNVTYGITDVTSQNSKGADDTVMASNSSFVISQANGSIYTNTLLDRYKDHFFTLNVRAEDFEERASQTKLLVGRYTITLQSIQTYILYLYM